MKQFFQRNGTLIFWIVALLHLTGITIENSLMTQFSKPLLVPILFLWALSFSSAVSNKHILLAGLFFSFVGDVMLMLDSVDPLYFIFGLVAFLLTQVFYCVFFLKIKSALASLLRSRPYLIIPVIIYVVSLLGLLLPHLGALKLPVTGYALVLGTMLLCSIHVFYKAGKPSGPLFLSGAILFVLSDSLLAINKFYHPFSYAGILIMLTYCTAQWLIVKAFLQLEEFDVKVNNLEMISEII